MKNYYLLNEDFTEFDKDPTEYAPPYIYFPFWTENKFDELCEDIGLYFSTYEINCQNLVEGETIILFWDLWDGLYRCYTDIARESQKKEKELSIKCQEAIAQNFIKENNTSC